MKQYIVFCHECNKVVGMADTLQFANDLELTHVANTSHLAVWPYNYREAEERGIEWPEGD